MPRLCAAAPPAESITPALIAAATKEGQLTWYTSADLQLAEKVGKAFEQKFPGIRVHVERAGGERIKLLVPCVPEHVARRIAPEHRDHDGFYATVRASLCVIAYNTEMVTRENASKSFADLLDAKWKARSSRRIRATAAPS